MPNIFQNILFVPKTIDKWRMTPYTSAINSINVFMRTEAGVQKNITLKDIARAAGVSVVTVSRVVNNSSSVSPERATRVRKAIDELGYVPNEIARNLKQRHSHLIGYVVSSIGNHYFASVLKAVEATVQTEGYNILICSTGQAPSRELYYINWLLSRQVDGIILNTTNENDARIAELTQKVPMVLINRRIQGDNIHADLVDSDNFGAGRALAGYLTGLGHRRIGLINGNLRTMPAQERRDGFIVGMKAAGVTVDDAYPYVFDGDFTPSSGVNGVRHLMSLRERPTALVVMNNDMTTGALRGLREMGVRVPEDLSLCSFGSIDDSAILYVTPTEVELDAKSFGITAAKLLLERMADPSLPPREHIFPTRLIFGNSAIKA